MDNNLNSYQKLILKILTKFIIDNNLYSKIINNYNNNNALYKYTKDIKTLMNLVDAENCSEIFACIFNWKTSLEGTEFWCDIDYEWQRYIHKILKKFLNLNCYE